MSFPGRVAALVRGRWRRGRGTVVTDEDAVVEHLRWVASPIRRASRALGREWSGDERLRRAAPAFVLVRVTLDEGAGESAGSTAATDGDGAA